MVNELPGLVRVVRDKSVRTAFVCLQGQQGVQGSRGHWTLGWPAHLLLQGTIFPPADMEREKFNKTKWIVEVALGLSTNRSREIFFVCGIKVSRG